MYYEERKKLMFSLQRLTRVEEKFYNVWNAKFKVGDKMPTDFSLSKLQKQGDSHLKSLCMEEGLREIEATFIINNHVDHTLNMSIIWGIKNEI